MIFIWACRRSARSAPSRCPLYLLRLRCAAPQKDAASIAHANLQCNRTPKL